MRKILFTLLLLTCLSAVVYSQTHFKPGYFIDNDNEKVECLIKDEDWKNTPKSFDYKLNNEDSELSKTVSEVKEFGIGENKKFVKRLVNIDKTSTDINKLTFSKAPEYIAEELFLEELVKGQVSLYQYKGSDFERFFFEDKNSNAKELTYKSYKLSEHQIGTNENYKQELFNILACNCLDFNSFKNAGYTSSSLSKLFIKYHECSNLSYQQKKKEKKKAIIKVNIRPGIGIATTKIDYYELRPNEHNFGAALEYRFGTELEVVLPFNNNKWAFAIEPSILHSSSDKVKDGQTMNMSLTSLDLNIGIRHYFFLNNNTSLFVNAGFISSFPIQGDYYLFYINPNNDNHRLVHEKDDFDKDTNYFLGAGIKHNRLYGEIRTQTTRSLNNLTSARSIMYNSISFIFGYTLFDNSNKK